MKRPSEDVEYPDVDEEPSEDPVADFISAAEQEFAETGELTPETYEQFKEYQVRNLSMHTCACKTKNLHLSLLSCLMVK